MKKVSKASTPYLVWDGRDLQLMAKFVKRCTTAGRPAVIVGSAEDAAGGYVRVTAKFEHLLVSVLLNSEAQLPPTERFGWDYLLAAAPPDRPAEYRPANRPTSVVVDVADPVHAEALAQVLYDRLVYLNEWARMGVTISGVLAPETGGGVTG